MPVFSFFNPTGQLRRRVKMMKELTIAALVAGGAGLANADSWDKTFPKSDKVEHCKATFKNRFGITLVADVYKPKEGNPPSPWLPPSLKLRRTSRGTNRVKYVLRQGGK